MRVALAAGAAALVLIGAGCYSEGGPGMSIDRHAYVSTTWEPKTVTLIDTRTGQAFWSCDIPVGKKLVFQFYEGQGGPGQTASDPTPDLLVWDLMEPDENFGPLQNKMPVPVATVRQIRWTMRPTPEYPESMGGGTGKPVSGPAGASSSTPATK